GWRAVATWCEARGLCTSETAPGRHATPRPTPRPATPLPVPRAAPQRPPAADVHAVWAQSQPVTEDAAVRGWLAHRHLDPAGVAERDLARALPMTGPLPA